MKVQLMAALGMTEDDMDDKGSLEEGLASKREVPDYEKPIRYSRKIDHSEND